MTNDYVDCWINDKSNWNCATGGTSQKWLNEEQRNLSDKQCLLERRVQK